LRYRRCSTTKQTGLKTSRWPYALKLVLNFGGILDMGRWLHLEATVEEMVTKMDVTHIAEIAALLHPKQKKMRS
jgi:hypothetical protein